jgi:histidinol-phosphate aminotransferase
VLVKTPDGRAREIFEALKQRNILIKCLDGSHPQLRDCLRLTVGEPNDSDQLLSALRELLNGAF